MCVGVSVYWSLKIDEGPIGLVPWDWVAAASIPKALKVVGIRRYPMNLAGRVMVLHGREPASHCMTDSLQTLSNCNAKIMIIRLLKQATVDVDAKLKTKKLCIYVSDLSKPVQPVFCHKFLIYSWTNALKSS